MENQASKIIESSIAKRNEIEEKDEQTSSDAEPGPAADRARKVLERALGNKKNPGLAIKAALEILKGQSKEAQASLYKDIPTPALIERMDLLNKRIFGKE